MLVSPDAAVGCNARPIASGRIIISTRIFFMLAPLLGSSPNSRTGEMKEVTLRLTPKSDYNISSLKRQPNYRGQVGFRLEALRPRLSTGLPLSRRDHIQLSGGWFRSSSANATLSASAYSGGLEVLIPRSLLRLRSPCDVSVILPLVPLLSPVA